MTRYLISFDDGAMTFPEEELPDVAEAAHAVVQEAKDYGVWVSAANCIPTVREFVPTRPSDRSPPSSSCPPLPDRTGKTWHRQTPQDWRPKTVPGQLTIARASVPE